MPVKVLVTSGGRAGCKEAIALIDAFLLIIYLRIENTVQTI
jgi:hypothetical protein